MEDSRIGPVLTGPENGTPPWIGPVFAWTGPSRPTNLRPFFWLVQVQTLRVSCSFPFLWREKLPSTLSPSLSRLGFWWNGRRRWNPSGVRVSEAEPSALHQRGPQQRRRFARRCSYYLSSVTSLRLSVSFSPSHRRSVHFVENWTDVWVAYANFMISCFQASIGLSEDWGDRQGSGFDQGVIFALCLLFLFYLSNYCIFHDRAMFV